MTTFESTNRLKPNFFKTIHTFLHETNTLGLFLSQNQTFRPFFRKIIPVFDYFWASFDPCLAFFTQIFSFGPFSVEMTPSSGFLATIGLIGDFLALNSPKCQVYECFLDSELVK